MSNLTASFAHLLTYFQQRPSKPARKISSSEAVAMIEEHKLFPVREAWHYSWNIEHFFDELILVEHANRIYVFHHTPINEWSPAPLFSNDPTLSSVIAKRGKDCPFWFLKLTSFDDFLERRSTTSRNPRRNFPTKQSYPKVKRKLSCRLERFDLLGNEDLFIRCYDELKDPKYGHSGAKCVADALKNSYRAPRHWFKFYSLLEEESEACKGILLSVEDSRSSCGINIASERRNGGGYGVLLDVEVIKSLCSRNFHSYDSGISGRYGNSKDVIFLDALPTDPSEHLQFLQALGFDPVEGRN